MTEIQIPGTTAVIDINNIDVLVTLRASMGIQAASISGASSMADGRSGRDIAACLSHRAALAIPCHYCPNAAAVAAMALSCVRS